MAHHRRYHRRRTPLPAPSGIPWTITYPPTYKPTGKPLAGMTEFKWKGIFHKSADGEFTYLDPRLN